MKKYIWIFLLIGLFWSVLWQENISWLESENYVEPWKTKIINQDIAPAWEAGNLENIKLRFCNEMELNKFTIDLETKTRPWKSQEICMILSNVWEKETNVLVGFAEGITDEKWKMSCANDISNTNNFSKHIVNAPTT